MNEGARRMINEILQSGQLSGFRANPDYHLGGKYVRKLEDAFCDYFGVNFAVSMNSATSALHAACLACGVGQGTEVITTPYTFSASASCIKMCGAEVVFADIEPATLNLDARWTETEINGKTRAIIVVHLNGNPANMINILPLGQFPNVKIIEDCSQAIGAKYFGKYVGTLGDCGVFSFNQWKHINAGEGGMLITNDSDIAEKARLIRNHGETQSMTLGYNYRMTEITAAIALEQLEHLDENIEQRIELADRLGEGLQGIDGLSPPTVYPSCKHSYYAYPVWVDKNRDELQARLLERGIYFGRGGLKPLHLFPYYGGHEGQFPATEDAYNRVMFTDRIKPPMTIAQVNYMVKLIKECYGEVRGNPLE